MLGLINAFPKWIQWTERKWRKKETGEREGENRGDKEEGIESGFTIFLGRSYKLSAGMTTSPNVPPSAFEMVGKRFDSYRRSVCIARSLVAGGEGGRRRRREEVDRIGQRPTGNFIRNRPSVKLCPIENRYFILAGLSTVLRAGKIDRFFYGVGQASEKISTNVYSFVYHFGEGLCSIRAGREVGASRGHVNGLVSFSGQGKWPVSFEVIDGDAWNAIRHAP